jgi:hypothetical protein
MFVQAPDRQRVNVSDGTGHIGTEDQFAQSSPCLHGAAWQFLQLSRTAMPVNH